MRTSRTVAKSVTALAAFVLLGAASHRASAQVSIPTSSKAGPPPATAGAGLNGAYFNTSSYVDVTGLPAGSPTATFHVTAVDYPNGTANTAADSTTLATFLGVDGPSLSGASGNTLDTSFFLMEGFLRVDSPGILSFVLGSDDGSSLYIGGQLVISNAGLHSFSQASGSASFAEEGLYPVQIRYAENGGLTGILWGFQTPGQTVPPVATDLLYARAPAPPPGPGPVVPEPSALSLLLPGLATVGLLRRRGLAAV